jgi:cytochrome c peroxidase
MAGQGDENDISRQAAAGNISGPTGVWRIIEIRLQGNQNYVNAFKKAFPNEIKEKEDIKISHYANAISRYQRETFKSFDSPYDHYIAGDVDAMKESAKRGYEVFTTKGRCFECHTGNLFSDEKFYSLGFPQIGPGKGHGENGLEDFGRAGITKVKSERYKFMTPTLRNIALSAPYGHAGTFESLKDVIKAHFHKDGGLSLITKENLRLPNVEGFRPHDFYVIGKRILRQKILSTRDDRVPMLTDKEVEDLVSFLHALTDLNCLDMNLVIPKKVLSGLPVHN